MTMTTETHPHARVVIDCRRYDVAIVALDKQLRVHVAVHVRDSYAELVESIDGNEASAQTLLDAQGVPRRRAEMHVCTEHDVEMVTRPYQRHEDAAPMIEKLRLAAGLL